MASEQLSKLKLDAERPTICMYHDDPDGCCAAAIVRKALGDSLVLQPMAIGDPPPWERIAAHEQVVLVDFSLPLSDMLRLRDEWTFVWIDHHKTSLAALGEAMSDVAGIRSLDDAACVLTWQTFYLGRSLPPVVAYVGDRDVWRNALPNTRQFNEGLYQADFDPSNWGLWGRLLDEDSDLFNELLQKGTILYAARMDQIAQAVGRRAFETVFEGHRTLAINQRGTGDMGEFIRQAGYDVAYCYHEAVRSGKLQTMVTLYSDKVDVSEIARKHGGGGHPGAAGFQFERDDRPFPPGSETATD